MHKNGTALAVPFNHYKILIMSPQHHRAGCPTPAVFGSSEVRVSGGHLCEAETLTKPTGETADPYECRLRVDFIT